jgi:hypothetical protein
LSEDRLYRVSGTKGELTMRNALTWVLAIGAVLAATGPASAQGRRGLGGMFGGGMLGGAAGGIQLLSNASVQEELKLTDEQKDKLRNFAQLQQAKVQERIQQVMQDLAGGGDFQTIGAKIREEMTKFNAEAMKEVAPILKAEQLKRFKEIDLQQSGFQAFTTNDEVQKSLKLTDEQKTKYKKLADELQQDVTDLMQGAFGGGRGFGNNPEMQQKLQALNKQYNDKAKEMLTADQRKTYQDMLGKAFELRTPQRGG